MIYEERMDNNDNDDNNNYNSNNNINDNNNSNSHHFNNRSSDPKQNRVSFSFEQYTLRIEISNSVIKRRISLFVIR
ncbi:hypothetical protein ANTRET_LOCUS7079 [Anthophora retusa]